MPLNALRSFEAAARLGSFRAAAEELAVTPSAVSLQVRRLEEILGRPLFVRSHRSVALSETGARLAPRLSELFSEMQDLLHVNIGPESSLLRVSAMPSFAHQWLAPRLGRFSDRYPQYQIRVVGEDQLVSFDRGEADIGIRYGAGDYPGLHSELIAKVEAFPVCSPDFAERYGRALSSPSGLLQLPLIEDEIARRAPGLPTWRDWFAAAAVPVDGLPPGARFESLHMALMAALRGQGVALGLSPLVDDDLAAGNLMRPFEVAIPSSFSFWLVCKPERAAERKIAAFRAWITDEIGASQRAEPQIRI
jgi:LysR family glycine cleavage system transcriptional activator